LGENVGGTRMGELVGEPFPGVLEALPEHRSAARQILGEPEQIGGQRRGIDASTCIGLPGIEPQTPLPPASSPGARLSVKVRAVSEAPGGLPPWWRSPGRAVACWAPDFILVVICETEH
jgi:hypothetical protein